MPNYIVPNRILHILVLNLLCLDMHCYSQVKNKACIVVPVITSVIHVLFSYEHDIIEANNFLWKSVGIKLIVICVLRCK